MGVIDGNSPVVVLIGIIAGVALGAVGIYQRMQDGEAARLRKRVEGLLGQIEEAQDDAAAERRKRHELEDRLEDSQVELKRARGTDCPWPKANGEARCEGEHAPLAPQPGETFLQ